MAETGLRIRVFKAVEDGYLLALAAEGSGSEAAVAEKEAAQAIATLDPWQRRWLLHERVWWIADDAITLLARRLPVLDELLEQWLHRPINTYTHWWSVELESYRPITLPPTVAAAYRRLGLLPGTGAEQVLATRRRLARKHHPDTGGEHVSMKAINCATDTILEWLR